MATRGFTKKGAVFNSAFCFFYFSVLLNLNKRLHRKLRYYYLYKIW